MSAWPVVMEVGERGLTLGAVCTLLEAEALVATDPGTPVRAVGAADLMSDVLAFGTPGMLLLTGLTSAQAVRTAAVADLAGLVFVRDKQVPDEVLALARQRGVPVMRTRMTMFEAAGRLYAAIEGRQQT